MKLTIEKLLEILPGFKLDHRGKNLIGKCPQCHHDEFGISIEEGHKFGCYRKKNCGFSGNIFTLLRYLGKLDKVLKEKVQNLPQKIEIIKKDRIDLDIETPEIKLPIGWKALSFSPYLEERGFEKEDYFRYKVGMTNIDPKLKKYYVIFLCEQDKKIKGWVARRIQSKSEIDKLNKIRKLQNKPPIIRYINSYSDFSKLCYGIDEVNEKVTTIILVEGIFDKINVDKLLRLNYRDEIKCLATYKGAISDEQLCLINKKGKNICNCIVLYDSDIIKTTKRYLKKIQEYYNVLIGFHKEKDPGDMNEEDIFNVLDNLQTPIEFKSFKLESNKL